MTIDELQEKLRGKNGNYKRYIGSPLRYAGGKSLAVGLITEFLPKDVKKVVSPFIGGGSVEVALVGRNATNKRGIRKGKEYIKRTLE